MLLNSINKFLSGLLIAILVFTQTVIAPACAMTMAAQSTCCCAVEDANSSQTEQSLPVVSDTCSCHSHAPDHGLPGTPFKASTNSTVDLQKPIATIDLATSQHQIKLLCSKHKPLHLASNKLYLQKRVWLI